MKKIIILLLVFLCCKVSIAQTDKDLVQFTGVVVTGDSLMPVPYTIVMVKNTSRGTFSDYYGFFSFVAHMNDTIEFSCIGFRKKYFVIPDTLTENKYSIIQILNPDTFNLPTATVYPFPTKEEFARAFVNMNLHDDKMQRANRNLDPGLLQELSQFEGPDASMAYKNAMQYQQTRMYTAGQYQANQLLNPIAWAQFIDAWKKGAFKKKK